MVYHNIIHVVLFALAMIEIVSSSSSAAPNSIPLKIMNQAGIKLDLFWINHFAVKETDPVSGELKMVLIKQPTSPILSGGNALINSFPGHKFILRPSDTADQSSSSTPLIDDLMITKSPVADEVFAITFDVKSNKLIANRSVSATMSAATTPAIKTDTAALDVQNIKKPSEPITKPKVAVPESETAAAAKKEMKTTTSASEPIKSPATTTASTTTTTGAVVKEKEEVVNKDSTFPQQQPPISVKENKVVAPVTTNKTTATANTAKNATSLSPTLTAIAAKVTDSIKKVISTIIPPKSVDTTIKPVTTTTVTKKPVHDETKKYFWQDAIINFNDMRKLNIQNENLLFALFGQSESFLNQSILSIAHTYHINSCFFHIIDMTAGSDTGGSESRGDSTAAVALSPRAAYAAWEKELTSPLSPIFNQESHLLVITHIEEFLSSIINSNSNNNNNYRINELDFLLQLMDRTAPVSNVVIVLPFLVPPTEFKKYSSEKGSGNIGNMIGDFLKGNNNNKDDDDDEKSKFDLRKYLSQLLTNANSVNGSSGTSSRVEFNQTALIGRITRSEVQIISTPDTNTASASGVTAPSAASITHTTDPTGTSVLRETLASGSRETSAPLISSSELWYCQPTLLYSSQIVRIIFSITLVVACFMIVWMDQTYKRKNPGPVDSMTIVLDNAEIVKLRNYQQKLQFNYNQTAAGITNDNSSSASSDVKLSGGGDDNNNSSSSASTVKLVRSVTIQDNDFTYDSIISAELDSSNNNSNSNCNSDDINTITANNTIANSITPKNKSVPKRRKSISKNTPSTTAAESTTPVVEEYNYNTSSSSSFSSATAAATGRSRTPSRKVANAATDDGTGTAKSASKSSTKKRSASKGRKSMQ